MMKKVHFWNFVNLKMELKLTFIILCFISLSDSRNSNRIKRQFGGGGGGGCCCGQSLPVLPIGAGLPLGAGGLPLLPGALGGPFIGANTLGQPAAQTQLLNSALGPDVNRDHKPKAEKGETGKISDKVDLKPDLPPSKSGSGSVSPGNPCKADGECVDGATCVSAHGKRYCVCSSGKRPQGSKCV